VAGGRGGLGAAGPDRAAAGRRRAAARHARLLMAEGGAVEPTWPALLGRLISGEDLTAAQTRWVMAQVMAGEANPVRLGGFLVALRAKGETVDEIRGLADEMLAHAHRISVAGPAVDIVGTGGDMHRTVNISTMASVV